MAPGTARGNGALPPFPVLPRPFSPERAARSSGQAGGRQRAGGTAKNAKGAKNGLSWYSRKGFPWRSWRSLRFEPRSEARGRPDFADHGLAGNRGTRRSRAASRPPWRLGRPLWPHSTLDTRPSTLPAPCRASASLRRRPTGFRRPAAPPLRSGRGLRDSAGLPRLRLAPAAAYGIPPPCRAAVA